MAKKKTQRLKRGELAMMSPEQRREHIRAQQLRYRHSPKGRATNRRNNRKFAKIYAETKPFICVCKECGKEFNAPSLSRKRCPDCKNNIITQADINRARRRKRIAIRSKIIALALRGMTQMAIAREVGYSQSAVSALLRRSGLIKQWRDKRNERNV